MSIITFITVILNDLTYRNLNVNTIFYKKLLTYKYTILSHKQIYKNERKYKNFIKYEQKLIFYRSHEQEILHILGSNFVIMYYTLGLFNAISFSVVLCYFNTIFLLIFYKLFHSKNCLHTVFCEN